jgi:hypothetical protein
MLMLAAGARAQVLLAVSGGYPLSPIEYEVPALPATLTGLSIGATVITPADSSELTSLLTGGTVDGTTLATAAAVGPVVISLDADATYTGEFTFPDLDQTDWIYVVSDEYDSLPLSGTRTSAADRTHMPLFKPADNGGAYNFWFATLHLAFGAQKYRFIGLAATYPTGSSDTGLGLFVAGKEFANHTSAAASDAEMPSDIIIDRCEFYGRDTSGEPDTKGVNFEVIGGAIVDSRIVDIACTSSDDPMGIEVTNGGRELLFQNLEVTASAENIILGGTDGYNDTINDVVIRRCWLHKPAEWFATHPTFDGYNRTIKNLLELKKTKRCLVEGCVLEDVGESDSGQRYTAFVLTVRNQSGGDPNAQIVDVNIRNNLIRRVGTAIAINTEDDLQDSLPTTRVWFHDNLAYDTNYYATWTALPYSPIYISCPDAPAASQPAVDLKIEHNTIAIGPDGVQKVSGNFMLLEFPVNEMLTRFVVKDNYGEGDGSISPRPAIYCTTDTDTQVGLEAACTSYNVTNNVFTGEDATEQSNYPAGHFFESDYTTVGFSNYATATGAADFELTSGSYRAGQVNDASDGTALGCDIPALVTATAHTIDGDWN